jgi:hypothetical protein
VAIKTEKLSRLGRRNAGWRASLGPIEEIRPTKSEAVYALCDTIEAVISGSFAPATLSFGSYVTTVYRDITGWGYETSSGSGSVARVGLSANASRTEAIRLARRHLVQMAYPLDGLRYLESAGDLDGVLQHAHWLGFQRAYSTAKYRSEETGQEVNESEWHRIACDHADDPDLMQPHERAVIDRVRSKIAAGG